MASSRQRQCVKSWESNLWCPIQAASAPGSTTIPSAKSSPSHSSAPSPSLCTPAQKIQRLEAARLRYREVSLFEVLLACFAWRYLGNISELTKLKNRKFLFYPVDQNIGQKDKVYPRPETREGFRCGQDEHICIWYAILGKNCIKESRSNIKISSPLGCHQGI